MTQTTTFRTRFTRLAAPATAVAAALLLSGCVTVWQGGMFGPDTPGAPPSSQSTDSTDTGGDDANDGGAAQDDPAEVTPGTHEATFALKDQTFTFTPTLCVNDFGEEIRISGPGVADADRAPVFMDIDINWGGDFGAGTLFVYLDAEKANPSGSYLKGAIGEANESAYGYSMGDMMDGFEVEASYFSDKDVDKGEGTFTINCG